MATHKDALKRHRQSIQRRARNRHYRTMARTRVKAVRTAVAEGDLATAQASFKEAMSVLHRLVSKGIIHRNQAARRISRLNASVKKLALSQG